LAAGADAVYNSLSGYPSWTGIEQPLPACRGKPGPLSSPLARAPAGGPPPEREDDIDGEDQSGKPCRRARRRRDDAIIWSFIKNKLI